MGNREINFRFWDSKLKVMCYRLPLLNDFNHPEIIPLQFTGFYDSIGKKIYEGDILSDFTKTDEGVLQSKLQVFFNKTTGSWDLDNSFNQDKSNSVDLWLDLTDYKYKVVGNVYVNPSKKNKL